ncbi:hypothetical protein [Austwickia chelonae]|uniref:hypothetical protein n=1 Tax=Austwickia chelonae TaxID=100225 RepID=UPI003D3214A8
MGGSAYEVDDLEARLSLVGVQPRPASDDLFELDLRSGWPEDHDEAEILDVDPGRQEP